MVLVSLDLDYPGIVRDAGRASSRGLQGKCSTRWTRAATSDTAHADLASTLDDPAMLLTLDRRPAAYAGPMSIDAILTMAADTARTLLEEPWGAVTEIAERLLDGDLLDGVTVQEIVSGYAHPDTPAPVIPMIGRRPAVVL